MRKLTEAEVKELQDCKGIEGGAFKFFDILDRIYADDEEALKEIKKNREMCEGVDSLKEYPGAYTKTQNMYYEYMDELIEKIGYHK